MSRLATLVAAFVSGTAILTYFPASVPAMTQDSVQPLNLLEAVQSRGSVRILVELRLETPFQIEGAQKLANRRVQAQRAAISKARTALLNDPAFDRVKLEATYKRIPYIALEVDAEALRRLANSPGVESITEDMVLSPTLSRSIPLIGAERAWSQGLEGSGQTVAVVDTGVEAGHPFLGGRVVSEACFSSSASAEKATTLCPNDTDAMMGPGAAAPDKCADVEGCSHGTHVAGVAAGFGTSFHGVGRSADIIAIQVFSRFNDPSMCGGEAPCLRSFVSDQLRALEHIYDLRHDYDIAAVNLSLGSGNFSTTCENEIPAYTDMIGTLRAAGIATVVGSGNEGFIGSTSFPGCLAGAITVGATDASDEVAPFSNRAAWVDLLAPGVAIYSSVTGGEYGLLSGTSTASAHVAGSWAILKGAHPDAGVDDILSALERTGVPAKAPEGLETTPRIHVDQALSSLDKPYVVSALEVDTIPPAAVTDLEAAVSVRIELEPTPAISVSSSGDSGTSTRDKAVDGDPSTIWSTPGRSSMQVEQITFDLGAVVGVGGVRMLSREDSGAYFPRDFQIQLSNDNVSFATVASASGITAAAGHWYAYNIAPVSSGRFLRVRVTASNPHPTGLFFVQLAEVEVQKAVAVPQNGARLTWTAPGDDGMVGTANAYDIRWNATGIADDADFNAITDPLQMASPTPQPAHSQEIFELAGLDPETTYYFAMKTEDAIPNVSGLSNTASITTAGAPPAAVTTLSATTDTNPGSIELQWQATGDDGMEGQASTYDIRYSKSPITHEAEFTAADEVTGEPAPALPTDPAQSMTVGGLDADTEYFFAMKVGDEIPNWSLLSNSANARTRDTEPPATVVLSAAVPSGFDTTMVPATAASSSGDSGTLTKEKAVDLSAATLWSTPGRPSMVVEQITLDLGSVMDVGRVNLFARADNGAYFPRDFEIQLSNDNVNFTSVTTKTNVVVAAGGEYPVNVTPPVAGRYVRLRVTRSNVHPAGLFYVQIAEIEVYRAVAVPGNSVVLSWIAPGDSGTEGNATTYDIRWNTTGIANDADFNAITNPSQRSQPTPQTVGTPETLTMTGPPAESNVYIAMKSGDDETPPNVSNLSNTATVTTPGVPPAKVTTLSATALSDQSIKLTWSPVGDDGMVGQASTYDIRYSMSPITNDVEFTAADPVPGEPAPDPAGSPPQEVTVASLQPDTLYYFAMKVGDEIPNWSMLSDPAGARTDDTVPPATIALAAEVPSGFDNTMVSVTAASSSGDAGTLTKENAVDGSGTTLWSTPGRSSMVVEQITLDLGSVMDVGRVNLFARADNGDYFPRDFEIQLSSDNVNFTTVQTETDVAVGAGEEVPVNITPPGSGRYLRVRVTGSNRHPAGLFYVQLAEIEVYRAVAVPGNAVVLSWIAPGDSRMEGTASSYDIRWNTTGITNDAHFDAIGPDQVVEPPPRPAGTTESFTLDGLPAESDVYIAMKSADEVPNLSDRSNTVSLTTPGIPPAAVTTLAATKGSVPGSIDLSWRATGDDGMIGRATTYDIRYSASPITNDAEFDVADPVSGIPAPALPTDPPQEVTVEGLQPDSLYHFAMKVADEVGNWSTLSNRAEARTKDTEPPAAVVLSASVLSGFDYAMVAASATSSSGDSGTNTKGNVVDGNLSTIWSTPGRPSMVVEHITLDLGSIVDVGRVRLVARADNGDYFPRDSQIQVSTDNVNFTSVWTETDVSMGPGEEYPIDVTPPVSGRYVRVRVTRSNRHPAGLFFVQLAEIELHQAVAIPSNAAVLTWTAPGDSGAEGNANSYDIRWNTTGIADDADFEAIGPDQVVEPTPQPAGSPERFTLTGLAGESDVYIAMKSRDEESPANVSDLSNVVMVQTPMVPPAAITNLTATTDWSPGSIRLQWTATGDDGHVGQATAYDIRYDTSPIADDSDFDNAVPVNGEPTPMPAGSPEEMIANGLLPDAAYYFAMKVADEVGNWSPPSNSPLGLTLDSVPPAAINDLAASLFGGIELTHRPAIALSASGESGVNTKEKAVDGNPSTLWSTPGRSSMQVEFITLDLGAVVDVGRVRMLSRADNGAYFPRDFHIQVSSDNVVFGPVVTETDYVAGAGTSYEVEVTPPVTGRYVRIQVTESNRHPAGLFFVQIAEIECYEAAVPNGVLLSWTAPGDNGNQGMANSYQILYSTDRITDAPVDPESVPAPAPPGTGQSATVGNLPPGAYDFKVIAFDEAGNSSSSNIAEISIPCEVNCHVDPTSDLIWDPSPSENVTMYNIHAAELPGDYDFGNPVGSVPASGPLEWSLINYGFEVGVRYYVVVTAADDFGNQSDPSNEVDFTIDPITGLAMVRGTLGTAEE